jgi:hypothetical protein
MNVKAEPTVYTNKLTNLDSRFKVLLSDYSKSYVSAQMNPSDSENQVLIRIINGVSEVSSDMFSMSNNIESDIQIVNTEMTNLHTRIQREKTTNTGLKRDLGIVDNTSHASSEMIRDYELIYQQRYLRNWALVLSGLACIAAIGTVYKKQVVLPIHPPVV